MNALLSSGLTHLAEALTEIAKALNSTETPAEAGAALGVLEPKAPAAEVDTVIELATVRACLAELSQAGKTAQVKELLTSFGATKLSELKSEQYAAILNAAGALAA